MTDIAPTPSKRNSPLVLWCIFLGALLVRIFLPFLNCDSMHYYSSVGWAVVSGENWGKQAVVGVLEYSPLPTIFLLLLSPFSLIPKIGLHAGRILPAVAQALTVVTLFAVSGEWFKRWWTRGVVTAFGMILLGMGIGHQLIPGKGLLVADPFWALAPPALLMIGFARRLGNFESVRPLLIFSLAAATLIFAGPAGIVLSIAGMTALLIYGRKEVSTQGGTRFLSLMPIGYALVLAILFNLVIMSNPLFMINRWLPYFADATHNLPSLPGWKLAAVILWCFTAIAALIPMKNLPFSARSSWILAIGCLPIFLFRKAGSMFIGGESILMGTVILALVFAMVGLFQARNLSLGVGALALAITVTSLLSVVLLRRHAHAFETFVDSDRPSPSQITDYLDNPEFRRWKDSRVLVFGSRASALYCIHNEVTENDRFIGNVDFNIYVLMEHIEAEQLHLLIPPDDGRFYPKGSFFSQVHNRELQEDWLLYETGWNGWQLWRCIRARPQPGTFDE